MGIKAFLLRMALFFAVGLTILWLLRGTHAPC